MHASTLQERIVFQTDTRAHREPQRASFQPRKRMTLGGTFRYARMLFGLTIDEIAEDLKIRTDIIRAIERGDFHAIEEPIYRTLMVKTYAEYLGFEWKNIQHEYNRESLYTAKKEKSNNVNTDCVQRTDFVVAPRLLKHIFLFVGMAGIVVYLAITAGSVLARPALTIFSPNDQEISPSKTISIEGAASSDANVFINGQSVPKNKDGHFSQTFTLTEGVNSIRISASKKYSKETIVTRTVLYENPQIPLILNDGIYGKSSN